MMVKKNYFNIFKNGSVSTRLSYVIMGAGNLAHKQIAKGLLFLFSELAFLFFLVFYGITLIQGMATLGTVNQSWNFDKSLGIMVRTPGDNSMLMLIYGIMTVVICVLFIFLYLANIRSASQVEGFQRENKKIPTFKEDLKSLLDNKFHVTLLTIPMIGVVVFTIMPLVYMISLAFTNYDHEHLPPRNLFGWVGFVNFKNVLNGDISSTFFPVLGWTLVWALLATATCFFFGVLLALLINHKGVKFKKFWRTIFVITMAVPPFVSLLVMQNLLHAAGPLNTMLLNWGIIAEPIPFLTDALLAKVSVIFVNMWIGIPVTMLIATGILMNLPKDQLEAARMDGGNSFHLFRYITFPQILTVMLPSLIQQFIGNINNFNVIYLLTGGGPSNSNFYGAGDTDLLVTWLYKLTVEAADYNLASVIGIVTFILSAAFSLFAYTRTNSYKEGSN
ncbi:sugar ABC transporter permease [Listeria monocytogenes]|uniref:carbohydrate ABC transporter permease n=1 Tax=Listeria TaxID=1637 RepID=UPI0008737511|nr:MULTISPECIES: sugar ABC transporter permease [Listeria]EAC9077796.1 sugar ABC transporter permease [Listeria monocytogenes]EAD3144207.1 sugar ABC transporter permease [Listeria monocytogenes]EAD5304589.1 sugar ABC transporter permease [Listeria monocytogenes]EAE5843095.1 sugar ABC transporter permease [Listeria monocytogenes]EAG0756436.1 sugar ABC transporter permease [Listeria monocytogenes]